MEGVTHEEMEDDQLYSSVNDVGEKFYLRYKMSKF